MNLAGDLAEFAAGVDLKQLRSGEAPDEFGTLGYQQTFEGPGSAATLFDFTRGGGARLLQLARPRPLETWIEQGEPGLPMIDREEYSLMQTDSREVQANSPLGERVLGSSHLETRPIERGVILVPQDGVAESLTVALLVPVVEPTGIGLAVVSAALMQESREGLTEDLLKQGRQVSEEGPPSAPEECRWKFVRGPSGRRYPGCGRGTCEGECVKVKVAGERGVASFRCACDLTSDETPRGDG